MAMPGVWAGRLRPDEGKAPPRPPGGVRADVGGGLRARRDGGRGREDGLRARGGHRRRPGEPTGRRSAAEEVRHVTTHLADGIPHKFHVQ